MTNLELMVELSKEANPNDISDVLALKEWAHELQVPIQIELPRLSQTQPVFETCAYDHYARA